MILDRTEMGRVMLDTQTTDRKEKAEGMEEESGCGEVPPRCVLPYLT